VLDPGRGTLQTVEAPSDRELGGFEKERVLLDKPERPFSIPFQYVRDGCYARAHKMRQIITELYGYCCEKVFSFAIPYPNRLAVKANKWSGCCVTWWYHVAPLVRVRIKIKLRARPDFDELLDRLREGARVRITLPDGDTIEDVQPSAV
jgi:hypothetical protein